MDPLRPPGLPAARPGPTAPGRARGLRGISAFAPRLPPPSPGPAEPPPLPEMFRALGLGERPPGGKALAQPGPAGEEEDKDKDKEEGATLAAPLTRGQILWQRLQDTLPTRPGQAAAVPTQSPPGPLPTPESPPAAAKPTPGTKPVVKGTPVPLGVNLVKIHCQNKAVYQYHVTFSPEVECRSTRFAMLKEHRAVTGDVLAFDGSILFLPIQIPKHSVKVQRKSDGQEISITIHMTKVLEPSSDLCIPFYNVVFRRVMKILNMSLVGRHFFEPAHATVLLKHGLQIWPGYAVSIQKKDGGLFLMVDSIQKIIRSKSVLLLMQTIHCQSQVAFQDECIKELVGSVVITRYNNRTYRVDDIDWDTTPKDTFTLASGEKITFVEYYRKTYGITISDLNQPLLIHRPKLKQTAEQKHHVAMVMLVPELSFLTGLSSLQRNRQTVKEVMWEMMQSPQQHYRRLTDLLRHIQDTPEASQELQRWGLHLDMDIHRIQGHILPTERINLQRRSFFPDNELNWHREATKDMPILVIPINSWLLVYPKRLRQVATDLLAAMRSTCGALGMQLGQPLVQELWDDRTESYVRSIQSGLGSQGKLQLLLCIIPRNRDDLYRAIKKLCCVQTPVPSQVISAQTLMGHPGKMRSVVQKVLLQINCKLGGQLWGVDIPLKQMMVVGMDIHHSQSQGARSVIGFVASMNHILTKWHSRVVFQLPHQEIADSLRLCLSQALNHFLKLNHSLPMKIVVYRDGVSDSQLDTVLKYEVPQIQKSFSTFQNYQPSLVVLVVQKQLGTNFYSLMGKKFTSAPPGVVLDHTITSTDWNDFFLLAHHSQLGCCVPTRYILMCNSTNLSTEHLQRLTFKLCHLYWNWTGTIRIPAPCKYAHRLAFLAGQVLHQEPSAHLSKQLFFL